MATSRSAAVLLHGHGPFEGIYLMLNNKFFTNCIHRSCCSGTCTARYGYCSLVLLLNDGTAQSWCCSAMILHCHWPKQTSSHGVAIPRLAAMQREGPRTDPGTLQLTAQPANNGALHDVYRLVIGHMSCSTGLCTPSLVIMVKGNGPECPVHCSMHVDS